MSRKGGPAPIASFDHDVSEESSPESKQTFQLPEIREDTQHAPVASGSGTVSEPVTKGALAATSAAPRIDISRASSSSVHDSRDSSPEAALLAGTSSLAAGFKEDGAEDLRSSTEELHFLEGQPGPPEPPPPPRRHSRKDSQTSEIALLGISGRVSRLSSVGSAHSAALSVTSARSNISRSPSPHRMLLETSFCGPKPITDPEVAAAAAEEALLPKPPPPAPVTIIPPENVHSVKAEVTVEPTDADKRAKEARNRARVAAAKRAPVCKQPSQPEVYKSRNKDKDIIRIRLKPGESEDESERESIGPAPPVVTVAPGPPAVILTPSRPTELTSNSSTGVVRKSSFCSLFKSSPVSSECPRRKQSLSEGRSRSKSRDRAASAGKIRGSVLALFKVPRRASAHGGDRSKSPSPTPPPATVSAASTPPRERLRYYESTGNVIHIPLHTPPDESPTDPTPISRPASAPAPPTRTVLPDGSIIIPLHSPTERAPPSPEPEPKPDPEPPPVQEPVVETVELPLAETVELSVGETVELSVEETGELPVEKPAAEHRRLLFSTQVGSGSNEQVFMTQLSLTTTPSIASDLSGSITSSLVLRDTRVTTEDPDLTPTPTPAPDRSPIARDSSSSSQSSPQPTDVSEAAIDVVVEGSEARGLVVQESFEELPYVPTTLPLERSLALPMVPVRDRKITQTNTASIERPRGSISTGSVVLPPPLPPRPAPASPLHIKLPKRTTTPTTSVSTASAQWVDFEESTSDRRAPPKRIQTLPVCTPMYVQPADCRCECHHHDNNDATSTATEWDGASQPQPFTADLDLEPNGTGPGGG